jgi:hypothetical protein
MTTIKISLVCHVGWRTPSLDVETGLFMSMARPIEGHTNAVHRIYPRGYRLERDQGEDCNGRTGIGPGSYFGSLA